MKIENTELIEGEHEGKKVIFIPPHALNDPNHKDSEFGIIKRWNDKFVFVIFKENTKACDPDYLIWNDG